MFKSAVDTIGKIFVRIIIKLNLNELYFVTYIPNKDWDVYVRFML